MPGLSRDPLIMEESPIYDLGARQRLIGEISISDLKVVIACIYGILIWRDKSRLVDKTMTFTAFGVAVV